MPRCGLGNSMAALLPETGEVSGYGSWAALLLANLGAMAFDFALRQKVQGQNLNWFVVEQAVVVAGERFEARIGGINIADFIREQVLHLSYTAHDLAPFARDLGHVNADGSVKPPFVWNDEDRRARLAALDGLNEDDAAYILDTFPSCANKTPPPLAATARRTTCLRSCAAFSRARWVCRQVRRADLLTCRILLSVVCRSERRHGRREVHREGGRSPAGSRTG